MPHFPEYFESQPVLNRRVAQAYKRANSPTFALQMAGLRRGIRLARYGLSRRS